MFHFILKPILGQDHYFHFIDKKTEAHPELVSNLFKVIVELRVVSGL